MLASAPNLADQVYDAIVAEICAGRLGPGTHLVQERLAAQFGVSRQPVQQAMTRLKADGVVEELGRRGLFVAPLDPDRTGDHYGVRAALDGWAARVATVRLAAAPKLGAIFKRDMRAILKDGRAAAKSGDVALQVAADDRFHFAIYAATGNPMIASTAEPHWRYLRRAMAVVLDKVAPPAEIWRQHAAIFEAIAGGDAPAAERLAIAHAEDASERLVTLLRDANQGDRP